MNLKSTNKVNVEEIMKKVKHEVALKKANNLYPESDLFEDGNGKNSFSSEDLGKDAVELFRYTTIRADLLSPSRKRYFGRLITLIKRVVRKTIFWNIKSVADQTTFFNNLMVKQLDKLQKEIYYFPHVAPAEKSLLWKDGYARFEDHFRGPESDIESRQKKYIKAFKKHYNVLDIGCGRGEFLELLKKNNIEATGIDLDPQMVAKCKGKGLSAFHADALDYLSKTKNNQLGGIMVSHVVEHLSLSYLTQLLEACFRKLKDGGLLVIETPNPLCMYTAAINFSRDLTHKQIMHPDTLRFLLSEIGFVDFEVKSSAPFPKTDKLKNLKEEKGISSEQTENIKILNENIERLNSLIFGEQDYSITAQKPTNAN